MTKTFIINNLEFAQKQLSFNDSFAVFSLKRLTKTLTMSDKNAQEASVYFELSGGSKQFRYPSLRLHIKVELPAICQRCLSDMRIHIDLSHDYLISEVALEECEESDEIDWLEKNKEMDLQELIEDELLLAIPIAPLHEKNCVSLSTQSGEKMNPFAVLKGKINQ
jgi:uncharacterized protein